MPATVTLSAARALLGTDVLGPEEIAPALGAGAPVAAPSIPFTERALQAAHRNGEMLVLRLARIGETPLTLMALIERMPAAFDQKLLRGAGYLLKNEWGIALEPLAATDTCMTGWALSRKDVLAASCNLTYDEQEPPVQEYARALGVEDGSVRRRTAIEAAYDTVLYFCARGVRLLPQSWDWTGTRTLDAGYLNVGGFGERGMQVLSFSRAIRHGALGVCPTRQPLQNG